MTIWLNMTWRQKIYIRWWQQDDVIKLPQDSEGQRGAQLFEGGIEAADLLQVPVVCIPFLWQHDGIGVNELPMNLYGYVKQFVMLIYFDIWLCILTNMPCRICEGKHDVQTVMRRLEILSLQIDWKFNFAGCFGRLLAVPGLNSANVFLFFFKKNIFLHCSKREISANLRIAALVTCLYMSMVTFFSKRCTRGIGSGTARNLAAGHLIKDHWSTWQI